MGQHNSAFANHPAAAAPDLQLQFAGDLQLWAQPLVMDQITHYYFDRLRGRYELARELSVIHYRMWRHLLNGDGDAATQARLAHEGALLASGLDLRMAEEADRQVLDELMDVVVTRFQRTPSLARGYGQTLLDTAARLARTQTARSHAA